MLQLKELEGYIFISPAATAAAAIETNRVVSALMNITFSGISSCIRTSSLVILNGLKIKDIVQVALLVLFGGDVELSSLLK